MTPPFTAACIQNRAGPDMDAGLADAAGLVCDAREAGADLICLPEYFSCLDVAQDRFEVGARTEEDHPALPLFSGLARELEAWILVGSLAIRPPDGFGDGPGEGKILNRSYMIDATGVIAARYDKVHLFDVDLKDGESYRESDTVAAGGEAVLAPTPWGLLGMSVCYDLRFPHLYRTLAQAGASFLTVPAAFTKTTGEAHWHVLLRARAIETGCYVFAPCQYGAHGKAVTYGHSLIIDPWGRVLADGGEDLGFITARVDPAQVEEARRMIPALKHDRPFDGPKRLAVSKAG